MESSAILLAMTRLLMPHVLIKYAQDLICICVGRVPGTFSRYYVLHVHVLLRVYICVCIVIPVLLLLSPVLY